MLGSPECQVAAGVTSSLFPGLPAEATQRVMVGKEVSLALAGLTPMDL